MNHRLALLVGFLAFILMGCFCGGGNQEKADRGPDIPFPPHGEVQFRERFGEPDNVTQLANIRVVSYWQHKVDLVYRRSGDKMLFDKFQDSDSKAEIDDSDVLVRMYDRDSLASKLRKEHNAKKAEQEELQPNAEEDVARKEKEAKPFGPGSPAMAGPFKIDIVGGTIGKVELADSSISKDAMLSLTLRITNTSEFPATPRFPLFARDPKAGDADLATLGDGARLFPMVRTVGTTRPAGSLRAVSAVPPGRSVDDVLVFQSPAAGEADLELLISGSCFGGGDVISFSIPRSFFVKLAL